jgi:hypothetical protein
MEKQKDFDFLFNFDTDRVALFSDIFVGTRLSELKQYIKDNNLNSVLHYDFVIKCLSNEEILKLFTDKNSYICLYRNKYIISDNDVVLELTIGNRHQYKSLDISVYHDSSKLCNKDIDNNIKLKIKDYSIGCLLANIDWYYWGGDCIRENMVSEVLGDTLYPEAYPFIPDLDKFIESYLDSDESVLFLIGKPGTGKTRLCRYIMKKIGERKTEEASVYFTSDKKVLDNERIFMDFISSEADLMILEDIDTDLKSRTASGGNDFMYRLLNVSDGILKNYNRKIILSTNLPSTKDVDPALIRDGRCFASLSFRSLTLEESRAFLDKFGKDIAMPNTNKIEYTLAELYKYLNTGDLVPRENVSSIGFSINKTKKG